MYDNGTGAPAVGAKASQAIQSGMTPGSTSLLCLTCHAKGIYIPPCGAPGGP